MNPGNYGPSVGGVKMRVLCMALYFSAPLANFVKSLKDVSGEERSQISLVCEVAADNAEVQWCKGKYKINNSIQNVGSTILFNILLVFTGSAILISNPSKYIISREGRICKLKILNASFDDVDYYQCESNCDVTRCKVNVTSKMELVDFTFFIKSFLLIWS